RNTIPGIKVAHNGPTGPFVLPNYYQMISDLKAKDRALGREAALHP
ncbi:hypothetical protein VP01_7572g1, partial [Puccinia sorghi]